jgi:GNAT superfamily N-acetyltransferase
VLRPATRPDLPVIEEIMIASLRGLGREAYDEGQVESAVAWIGRPDVQLIDDGTYYVVAIDRQIVACGGWSKRGKLYAGSAPGAGEDRLLDPATEPARVRAMFTLPSFARRGYGRLILERCEADALAAGFRRVELMAMRSGERMYLACGYEPVRETDIVLGDGAVLGCTLMTKTIAS